MKRVLRYWLASCAWICALLLLASLRSQGQQPQVQQPAQAQQPSSSPAPAQTQSAPQPDPAAEIDQLLKKANEQMNVQGRMNEAAETAKQALEISQRIGDKQRIVQSMLFLSSAYYYVGRMQESLEMCEQAVKLAGENGNRKALSRALNNMATAYRDVGRYEDSLNTYNQVVALGRELKDTAMLWTTFRNMGVLYEQMGELDKAEAPLKESLRLAHELQEEPWKSQLKGAGKVTQEASLLTLGLWEVDREHYTEALNYYEQSLASNPENPMLTAELLTDMAAVHEKVGESQKSIDLLQQALKIQESTGSGINGVTLSDLGHSQESLGQLKEALATQERALALVRKLSANPEFEWMGESRIGHVERALGENEKALEHYQNAIKGLELLRAGALKTESGRASILAKTRSVFAETADLLVAMHREGDALEIAERGRARAFLDMLAVTRSGLPDELAPEQKQKEDAILAKISATQKELWKENLKPEEEKKHKAELSAAESDLEAFHLEVRQANPRYASVHYPQPINASLIQKNLLDSHTVLLEFLLGEKRSLLWVVSKQKLSVGVLPARKEIEEEVAAYRKALTERTSALTLHASLGEVERRGKHLYASLLKPVENTIPPGSTLIIVPDGNLGYLPFESLIVGNRRVSSGEVQPLYLVDKFAIAYGPSASALAAVRGANTGTQEHAKTLLAFGDPVTRTESTLAKNSSANKATRSSDAPPEANGEKSVSAANSKEPAPSSDIASAEYVERGFSLTRLPFTRDEVLGISKLYPAAQRQVYLGEDAREEIVKSEKLDAYRYIHFASHGFIDESHPERSGILFSRTPNSAEDGVLQMDEILRLKLNADLVTLSACSTGLGKLVNGEGILGLTRAFFYAGARNVTVSLWNVNDSATAALMKSFYGGLNRSLPKTAALRQAKLSVLHGENKLWRQPYFWAAFVLVGEGR
jgi:CHAT domain-containing protein